MVEKNRSGIFVFVTLLTVALSLVVGLIPIPSGWNVDLFHVMCLFALFAFWALPIVISVKTAVVIELWLYSLIGVLWLVGQIAKPDRVNELVFRGGLILGFVAIWIIIWILTINPVIARDPEIIDQTPPK